MPIYEVKAPDGSILEIQGPEGASDAQLINTAASYYRQQEFARQQPAPEPVAAPKRAEDVGFFEGIGAAGRRGIESLGDVASGLGLAGTSLTGTEEETRRKMQAIRAEQMKPQETPGTTFADLERIYKEKGLMSALGEVPKYATEQILQSAPQMAAPLAAGAAASPFLTPVGGALVGMGTYAVQQFGNFLVRQAVEKDDPKELEVAKAAMTAAGTAPIGYFADRFTLGLGSMGKTAGKEVMAELAKRSGMDLAGGVAKQVGKGAIEGIIAEAPTEVLEQAAERYQAGLSLSGPDAMNEYKEAFFGAAAAGGGMKGVSTGLDVNAGIRQARMPEPEIPANLLPETPQPETPEVPGGEGPAIRALETEFPTIGTVPEVPEVEAPTAPPTQEAPTVEAPTIETPPIAEAPAAEAPIVEAPVVQAPAVEAPEAPQVLHPFEVAIQSGDQNEISKVNEAAKQAGIEFNFNDQGRINLDDSRVQWDKMKTLRTGQSLLNHIRDFVPLDTREILDRITPYVKDIPIYFNKSDPYAQHGKMQGTHAFHQPGGRNREASRIEFLTKSPIGNTLETITHEFVHGATVRNYYEGHHYNVHKGAEGNKTFAKPASELNELAAYLIDNHSKDIPFFKYYNKPGLARNKYVEYIAKELLTWGTTNRETQERLKQIKLPSGKSVWSKFVETMRNLLQIPATETNALTKILDLQDKMIGGKPIKPLYKTRAGRDRFAAEEQVLPEPEASMAPRQRAIGGQAPEASYELRPLEAETPKSRYLKTKVYEFVDKYVDLKDIIKAINAGSKKLDETWNAYRRETLYHNRVAWMTNQFLKNDLKPLAEDMVKRNVSEAELNNYLLARFAKERNEEINRRNPEATHMQDRGSGVETRIAEAYMKGASKQEVQQLLDLFAKNQMELNENEKAILKDLSTMTDAKRKSLAEVAKRIDKIIKETQQISVAGGLEKQTTIDYWRDLYPNYAPLKRSPEELDFVEKNYGTGRGFSTKSGLGRAATGSLKTVDNIMANIVLQRDMAIVRAEKGRIGRALYAMFLQHPNPAIALPVNPEAGAISKANDFYAQLAKQKESLKRKIAKVDADLANGKDMDPADIAEIDEMRKKISNDEARYVEMAKKAESVKQNIIDELGKLEGYGLDEKAIENLIREPQGAWYNPKTGLVEYRTNAYLRSSPNVLAIPIDGETRYLIFNPGDERATRLVKSLKSADVQELGEITSAVGKATRWIAKVNTQFNPFFGIVNMMRDVQGAQFNLSSTPLAGKQMAVNANIPGSMATIYRSLRAERAGGEATGPYAEAWAEFQRLGGPTGIKDMLARQQDKLSVLGEEISKLQESPTKSGARKALGSVFGLMSDFNDVMENSVRLAAFIEAKKKFEAQGYKTDVAADKAAELAKNLTVNFNRKGAKSQLVNSWFAFFNAAVQGSARLAETMTGPAGKKIASSLVLLGVLQQMMLSSAGFDDEDPPEFVRAKNFVIPTEGGKYISLPMPLGFNAFVNFGRILTAAGMDGGKRPAKYMGDMVGMISDSFNPLGSSGLSVQTIAPTVADPFVALGENRDAFGRPIYREDRANKPTPGYLRSSEGASNVSKIISQAINQLTGGTDYQKGYLSPTADEIDYLAGQIGGGTYREAKKVAEYAKSKTEGEEVAPYKVPLAGRFMGDTGSDANARSTFYQNVTQLSKYEDEIKGRAKNHQDVQAFLKEHPEARLYSVANSVENEIIQMNKLRKEMIARGASQDQLKRLNEMKIQRMRQFNELVKKATPQ